MRKAEGKLYSFHAKILSKHNLGVVEFPSIFLISKILSKHNFLGVVEFPSIFLISKIQGSGFSFQFLKNYHNLQFFRGILNFAQECYYLENKVGVVDFTKARGVIKFQSPWALWALGL